MVGMVPSLVEAQNINEAVPMAITAMKQSKWEEAQAILAKVVEAYGDRGQQLFGGRFGVIYYNKGFCEIKIAGKLGALGGQANLDKASSYYELAKGSFENCYKFPSDDKGQNLYHKRCLLYWGQAHQSLGEYEDAIKKYKKFLAEKDDERDKYDPGTFAIGMAICHFRLEKPDFKAGIQYFETALNNKDKWQTPDEAVVTAFQALTEAVIKTKNEQALIDFLNQNRAAISLQPNLMVRFTPFFQKLAVEAMDADMMYAAFNLFGLIPGSTAAVDDMQVIQDSLALYPRKGIKDGVNLISKDSLKLAIKKVKDEVKAGDPPEVLALSALAFTHEKMHNIRGSFAAYEQLELYFNKSKKREDHLYHLVRTSSSTGQVFLVEQYGKVFLDAFPNSKYIDGVRSFMLSSLFASGEYKKCLEVASSMIETLKKPSKQHDLCLHVLGGSMFYLGQFVDAHPYLVEHVETYPKSDYKIAAKFFVGSNLSRLQQWAKAALKLDEFLAEYPDAKVNVYLPFALYDRANVHFSENEYEKALVLLNRIEAEFRGSSIEEMAYNLKGNILQSDGNREEAEKYYLKALVLAETKDSDMVAGESLNYLVGLLGVEKINKEPNPNMKDAISYYDKFWKNYQESPYKAQVAVAGIPALSEAKRGDEALANLQGVIAEMAALSNPAGLEEAIGSYTKYWLLNKTTAGVSEAEAADQLKDHYYSFPRINSENVRARAMLRIAIIGVYEESLQKAEKEKNSTALGLNQARINQLFKELKNDFPVAKLSDFVLVRVGDYLRRKSTNPRNALPYYEERLKRASINGRVNAQFGIADVLGQSEDASEQQKAIATLQEVIKASKDDKTQRDEALYRIIEIHAKRGEWDQVVTKANEYKSNYTRSKSRVLFLLAEAYEKKNATEDAIKAYTAVYISNTSKWEVGVPALTRATKLNWDAGNQQDAYQAAARFIKGSTKAYNENKTDMPDDVREAWETLDAQVKEWEKSGRIKTLKEQEDAKKNA